MSATLDKYFSLKKAEGCISSKLEEMIYNEKNKNEKEMDEDSCEKQINKIFNKNKLMRVGKYINSED